MIRIRESRKREAKLRKAIVALLGWSREELVADQKDSPEWRAAWDAVIDTTIQGFAYCPGCEHSLQLPPRDDYENAVVKCGMCGCRFKDAHGKREIIKGES